MKRRNGGDRGGSQQRAFSATLINYIQNGMLQSGLEALPPDLPRYLLNCQFWDWEKESRPGWNVGILKI